MNVQRKVESTNMRRRDCHFQQERTTCAVLVTSSEDLKHASCAVHIPDEGVFLGSMADAMFEFVSTREYQ